MPDIEAKVFFVGQVGKDRHASFLFIILIIFEQNLFHNWRTRFSQINILYF
jgi:hypothetical protein